jgi:hypothetical protein
VLTDAETKAAFQEVGIDLLDEIPQKAHQDYFSRPKDDPVASINTIDSRWGIGPPKIKFLRYSAGSSPVGFLHGNTYSFPAGGSR